MRLEQEYTITILTKASFTHTVNVISFMSGSIDIFDFVSQ